MVFVSGDTQYVKWRKFDQIHVSLRLFFPDAHGFVRALGIFVDCNPLGVVADMLVLAASEHLGELEICARDRLKCWGLGVACAILILVGFCG